MLRLFTSGVALMFGAMLAGTSLLIGTPGLFVAGMGVEDLFAKATKRDFTYDSPRQVARIAGARLRPGQTIYAICTEPVAYQLLHVRPPTKYPFYLHAFTPQFASALEIDPKAELQAIFAQRPAVFIRGGFDACGFPPSSWQITVGNAHIFPRQSWITDIFMFLWTMSSV